MEGTIKSLNQHYFILPLNCYNYPVLDQMASHF